MKITDALLGEHGVFYAQFDYLEKTVPASGSLSEVQALAGQLTAALETHACMENHLLFSRLESHPGLASGPLPVMRQEHEWIERMLGRVQEVQEIKEARDSLLGAIQVARQHFPKEEQILFPMAEQVLGVEPLEELGQVWAQKRQVAMQPAGCAVGGHL